MSTQTPDHYPPSFGDLVGEASSTASFPNANFNATRFRNQRFLASTHQDRRTYSFGSAGNDTAESNASRFRSVQIGPATSNGTPVNVSTGSTEGSNQSRHMITVPGPPTYPGLPIPCWKELVPIHTRDINLSGGPQSEALVIFDDAVPLTDQPEVDDEGVPWRWYIGTVTHVAPLNVPFGASTAGMPGASQAAPAGYGG